MTPTCVCCKLTLVDFTIKSNMKEVFSLLSLLSNATLYQHGRPSSLCDKRMYTKRKEYYEFSKDSGVRRLKMYRSLCVGDIVPICKFLLDHNFPY